MGQPTLSRIVHTLRKSARPPADAAVSDRELLDRYLRDGDDEAFRALVCRHGVTVLAACRQVLADPADVDDAFQATFVVLLKKAKAVDAATPLAGWLFAVAHRVAVRCRSDARRRKTREAEAAKRARRSADPPDLSWREAAAVLHDELNALPGKYRLPLLLCCVHGLTRDEAAEQLGTTVGAVRGHLERGRSLLERRLTRRGVVLSAGLLAVLMGGSRAAGGPPADLIDLTLRAADGSVNPAVAALAHGAFPMTALLKHSILPAALVLGLIGVGLGLARPSEADRPAMAKEQPKVAAPAGVAPRTVTGTVIGPDGKPVEGAVIRTLRKGDWENPVAQQLATTDRDGRFTAALEPLPAGTPELRTLAAAKAGFGPDWVGVGELTADPITLKLVPDDVPVKGRVTDLQGKPVAKATVRIKDIATTRVGNLSRVMEEWQRSPQIAVRMADKIIVRPVVAGFPETVTTAVDGTFEVRGIGRGRLLALVFEADGLETAACRVVVDPTFDPKTVKLRPGGDESSEPAGPDLYGPQFTHAAKPSQPIVGVVTDAKTGKPIPGARVGGGVADGWWENHAYATADGNGKYRLLGVGKGEKIRLTAFPHDDRNSPYFPAEIEFDGTPGLTEITADIALPRGVVVTGRITNKATGEPVAGAGLHYEPLGDNPFADKLLGKGQHLGGLGYSTDADGRFRLLALPGAGTILAQDETRGLVKRTRFTQVRMKPQDKPRAMSTADHDLGESFTGYGGHYVLLANRSAYQIIEPKETDEAITMDLTFDPGRSVTGKVVGPDGRPATGVTAYQLTACYDQPRQLPADTFTAIALEPDHPRAVLFVDAARKLSAAVTLKGGEKELTVKLQPWGKLTGRLLDASGKPVAGTSVTPETEGGRKHFAHTVTFRELATTTGANGRFALDVPALGVPYRIWLSRKGEYLNTGVRDQPAHMVKPGETTDVGDVKVKPE